jgi:hypothetical protein
MEFLQQENTPLNPRGKGTNAAVEQQQHLAPGEEQEILDSQQRQQQLERLHELMQILASLASPQVNRSKDMLMDLCGTLAMNFEQLNEIAKHWELQFLKKDEYNPSHPILLAVHACSIHLVAYFLKAGFDPAIKGVVQSASNDGLHQGKHQIESAKELCEKLKQSSSGKRNDVFKNIQNLLTELDEDKWDNILTEAEMPLPVKVDGQTLSSDWDYKQFDFASDDEKRRILKNRKKKANEDSKALQIQRRREARLERGKQVWSKNQNLHETVKKAVSTYNDYSDLVASIVNDLKSKEITAVNFLEAKLALIHDMKNNVAESVCRKALDIIGKAAYEEYSNESNVFLQETNKTLWNLDIDEVVDNVNHNDDIFGKEPSEDEANSVQEEDNDESLSQGKSSQGSLREEDDEQNDDDEQVEEGDNSDHEFPDLPDCAEMTDITPTEMRRTVHFPHFKKKPLPHATIATGQASSFQTATFGTKKGGKKRSRAAAFGPFENDVIILYDDTVQNKEGRDECLGLVFPDEGEQHAFPALRAIVKKGTRFNLVHKTGKTMTAFVVPYVADALKYEAEDET